MTTMWKSTFKAALALLIVLVTLAPDLALACPVCFGAGEAVDSPMVQGMNNGILVLLGVIGGVQVGFVAFFWGVRRRVADRRRRMESFQIVDGGVR